MNYLAHAHLAYLTQTSITGNLLGDFVKGNLTQDIKPEWQLGIRLHRKIDIYTDSHAEVKKLKVELGQLRRFSGIILDILFDHVIAKHFSEISNIELSPFANLVYRDLEIARDSQPLQFQRVTQRMIATDWLSNYRRLEIIERALSRTSQRISTKPDLTQAIDWYQTHTQQIDIIGLTFYRELIIHSKQQAKSLIPKLIGNA